MGPRRCLSAPIRRPTRPGSASVRRPGTSGTITERIGCRRCCRHRSGPILTSRPGDRVGSAAGDQRSRLLSCRRAGLDATAAGLGVVRGPGCVGRNRCRGRVVVALAASGCGLARPCLRWLGVACGEHSAALGGCVVSRVRPADGAGADVGGAGADVLRGTGRTAAAGCQGFGLGAVPDRDLRLVARRGGTTRSGRVVPVELSLRSVRLGGHA